MNTTHHVKWLNSSLHACVHDCRAKGCVIIIYSLRSCYWFGDYFIWFLCTCVSDKRFVCVEIWDSTAGSKCLLTKLYHKMAVWDRWLKTVIILQPDHHNLSSFEECVFLILCCHAWFVSSLSSFLNTFRSPNSSQNCTLVASLYISIQLRFFHQIQFTLSHFLTVVFSHCWVILSLDCFGMCFWLFSFSASQHQHPAVFNIHFSGPAEMEYAICL